MKSRSAVFLVALLVLLLVSGCKSLSISVDDSNPPVFSFAAGQFAECCYHLAFLVVSEIPAAGDQEKVIWRIKPKPGTDNSVQKLPQITYGQVPPGFEQVIPSTGTAPALEEGKVYAVSGPRVEVPDAFIIFRIKNGKAILMSER